MVKRVFENSNFLLLKIACINFRRIYSHPIPQSLEDDISWGAKVFRIFEFFYDPLQFPCENISFLQFHTEWNCSTIVLQLHYKTLELHTGLFLRKTCLF